MPSRRRALAQYPGLLVHFEPRSLELPRHPIGEFAPCIIRDGFSKEEAEQVRAKPIENTS